MKRIVSLILSAILAFTAFGVVFARTDSGMRNAVGMSIAGFNTQDLYGNTVTSDILNNATVTIINEWATWCGPCVGEMPYLQQAHEYYSSTPEADAQILGAVYVSGDCTPASARQFLENNHYTWTNVLEDTVLDHAFATSDSIPNTIVVDRNGLVRDHHIGPFTNLTQLKNYIDNWIAIISAEEPEETPEPSVLPGDMDNDGELSISDALVIMRIAMGISDGDEDIADYDGSGTVEVSDALLVMRAAMGL